MLPSGKTTIRNAIVADAPELSRMASDVFYATFAHLTDPHELARYLAESLSPSRLAAEIADPTCQFLLSMREPEISGYAKMRTGYTPTCVSGEKPVELSRLYVRPEYHGQGVAHDLMTECHWRIRAAGYQTWWLGVWEPNARARAFYRKWGFVEVGVHPFKFGSEMQEDIVMVRPVK